MKKNNISSRPVILVLSDQDILRAGNQLIYRAIDGYINDGYFVVFLSDYKSDGNIVTPVDIFGKNVKYLKIIRFSIPLQKIINKLRASSLLKKKDTNNEVSLIIPKPEEVVDFYTNFNHARIFTILRNKLYTKYMFKKAVHIVHKYKVSLVCGYEIGAAVAAYKISKKYNIPLFTRYQGTFLYKSALAGTAKRDYPVHYKGTKVPAGLIIMEDDGTKGKETLELLGHSSDRIKCWMDGIDKEFIKKVTVNKSELLNKLGVPANKKLILTLSKLTNWKRHDRIIGAMPQILREHPDSHLIIAHRGPRKQILMQYAKQLGVKNNVTFIGPIPHNEVISLLKICDAYVNVNDHSNLSNPVLEALECGCPVISIDDGSLDNIINNNNNGILISLCNINSELPKNVIKLFKDEVFWKTIHLNALEYAKINLYTWKTRMEMETKEIRKLLSKNT